MLDWLLPLRFAVVEQKYFEETRHFATNGIVGNFIMRIDQACAYPLNCDRVDSTAARARSSIECIVSTQILSA
jgi:hypothetical protein